VNCIESLNELNNILHYDTYGNTNQGLKKKSSPEKKFTKRASQTSMRNDISLNIDHLTAVLDFQPPFS